MAFNDTPVAGGDVVFKANTGQFKADMTEINAVYARTTGAMSDEALKLAVAQEKLNRAIARQGPESYAAGRATVAYRAQVDQLAKSEAAAAAAAERAAKQRLAAYGAAAQTVGRTLTRYVTVPTALVTAAAVKMGVDFQQNMLLIQTQAGASAAEVHKLSGEVLQLAKVTPQGPNELAQGLFALESVGLRDTKALNALHVAAIASGEGLADLTTTTDVLAGALVTGIKGTENYQQAMDGLIAIAGEGKMHLQDLGNALGTGLLVKAKNAGLSLDQVGAALAVLTDRNIPAQKAATQLGTTFALMMAPSSAAQKALQDMGIDSDVLANTLREPNGLLKVLQMLRAGMDKVGKAQGAKDILSAFGRSRQSGAILTLVESLDSKVSSYQQKLDQYQKGVAKAAANRQAYLKSEAYQLHTALSTVESDLTSMGGKIAPAFVGAIHVLTELVDGFGKLPTSAKTDIAVIVGLLAVGGPLLLAIAAVIRAVQTIGTAFGRVPAKAGVAVAETDAELATLRTTAAETGVAAGAGLEAGVAGGVAGAEAKVGLLRASLLGLGALAIAPIVIPIVYDITKKFFPGIGPDIAPDVHVPGLNVPGVKTVVGNKPTPLSLTAPKGTSVAALLKKVREHKQLTKREFNAFELALKAGEYTGSGPLPQAEVEKILQALGLVQGDIAGKGRHAALGAHAQQHPGRSGVGKTKTTKKKPAGKFTTTLPTNLQVQLARAQLSGDVGAQRQALQAQLAFLQGELRKAQRSGNQTEVLQALQALQSVQDELTSLEKTGATTAKKTTSSRQKAYQAHLDAEENRLKINLARAKLAETKAGQNKAALDRAYKAERKSLTAEIDFYRKEAHDQKLALKERQHYAKQAIAAETARAKIGQAAKKASKTGKVDLAQAEQDFLNNLHDVFLNFAPNVFANAAQLRPSVTVNQSFPNMPVDQHRQARMANQAMRTAFDG